MLETGNCCLVVVDVQGRLAQLMHEKERLFKNIRTLIQGAEILAIPILWCQQVPEALGSTAAEIAELLEGLEPVNKAAFSCCGSGEFNGKLEGLGRKQVVLCGIESHVCIYQTAVQLLEKGFTVEVISDAVSSRTAENRQVGLEKMKAAGAGISSVEMVLFELVRTAEHGQFKEIARLI